MKRKNLNPDKTKKTKKKKIKTKNRAEFFEFKWEPNNYQELTMKDVMDKKILEKIQEGDLINTDQYRGFGVYYFDGSKLWPSLGEYGYFMPTQAWKFVEKHGPKYFEYCGCELFLIPRGSEVSFKCGAKPEKQVQWIMMEEDAHLIQDFLIEPLCDIIGEYIGDKEEGVPRFFQNKVAIWDRQDHTGDYTIVNGRKFDNSLSSFF